MARISIVTDVLKKNDAAAAVTRNRLDAAGVVALNIISAPGSGKTTLLERTLRHLGDDAPGAVLVGDLQTARDAERLAPHAAGVVQINTGRGCHLSADQVAAGLERIDLNTIRYLFIENVGNMVCPVSFDLGEHYRVAILSVPEGDDKVAKYPTLFQTADVIVINKIELTELLEFDEHRVTTDLAQVNTAAPVIRVSARTGQGLDVWFAWLRALVS